MAKKKVAKRKLAGRMIHMRGLGYASDRLQTGPDIDGLPGMAGDIVFFHGRAPYWIVEWQPDNGEVFAIVNALGEIALVGPESLTRNFRNT